MEAWPVDSTWRCLCERGAGDRPGGRYGRECVALRFTTLWVGFLTAGRYEDARCSRETLPRPTSRCSDCASPTDGVALGHPGRYQPYRRLMVPGEQTGSLRRHQHLRATSSRLRPAPGASLETLSGLRPYGSIGVSFAMSEEVTPTPPGTPGSQATLVEGTAPVRAARASLAPCPTDPVARVATDTVDRVPFAVSLGSSDDGSWRHKISQRRSSVTSSIKSSPPWRQVTESKQTRGVVVPEWWGHCAVCLDAKASQ